MNKDSILQKENYGFLRIAAAVPRLKVADPDFNTKEILSLAREASKEEVSIILFPEMAITAYTAADLFHQNLLQKKALEKIEEIVHASKDLFSVILIGFPLSVEGALYNAVCVIYEGKIYGIVPKTAIPNYKEFYERRWFHSARELKAKEVTIAGKVVPVGTDLLFTFRNIPDAVLGVEICEDMWTPIPPSSFQVLRGATIIANASASNDLVGKAAYRRKLILNHSGNGICAYLYASCGVHESTTDVVFGGHAVIAENGALLQESKRFSRESQLIISDIDIEALVSDRQRTTSFHENLHDIPAKEFRHVPIPFVLTQPKMNTLVRFVSSHPFIPDDEQARNEVCEEIFAIQRAGLAKRLEASGVKNLVIGVSGGLDSTLALLVVKGTFDLLGYFTDGIHALTMPGFGTSDRTKSNAYRLCQALNIQLEEIDITRSATSILEDIDHDMRETRNVTFQNVQARLRKLLEFGKANQLLAIDAGTGDLSEIALGWNTFSGDQISSYNVMGDVPKTLVQYVIRWYAETGTDSELKKTLFDILDTPISPELEKNDSKSDITQKTEDIIGPYSLHDFFLYYFLRWGASPKKIFFLSRQAFKGVHGDKEVLKWLRVFITMFFKNQWKRSVMPDGPKIGSVALSPRGDWRMPSDAEPALWLKDIDEIEEVINV